MEQTSEKERLGVFDKMPDPAHLLSTVRECGRIVLLKGGKIAAAVSAVDAFLDGNNADWQKREALPNARSGRRN